MAHTFDNQVIDRLARIETKLDASLERSDDLETRLGILEVFKNKIMGYALGASAAISVGWTAVVHLWKN